MTTDRRSFLKGLAAALAASATSAQTVLADAVFPTTLINPDRWHHYVWVTTHAGIQCFIDDVLVDGKQSAPPMYEYFLSGFHLDEIRQENLGNGEFTIDCWMKKA